MLQIIESHLHLQPGFFMYLFTINLQQLALDFIPGSYTCISRNALRRKGRVTRASPMECMALPLVLQVNIAVSVVKLFLK